MLTILRDDDPSPAAPFRSSSTEDLALSVWIPSNDREQHDENLPGTIIGKAPRVHVQLLYLSLLDLQALRQASSIRVDPIPGNVARWVRSNLSSTLILPGIRIDTEQGQV